MINQSTISYYEAVYHMIWYTNLLSPLQSLLITWNTVISLIRNSSNNSIMWYLSIFTIFVSHLTYFDFLFCKFLIYSFSFIDVLIRISYQFALLRFLNKLPAFFSVPLTATYQETIFLFLCVLSLSLLSMSCVVCVAP